MALKDRLDLIIKELNMSGRALERECGLANGSYSSLGDGVGADKLNKILFKFPQISAQWLLTGEGNMFLESASSSVKTDPSIITMPREVWKVIEDQAASLRAKDESLKIKDQQVSEVIALLKEQIKKGEDADGQSHAVPGAALG